MFQVRYLLGRIRLPLEKDKSRKIEKYSFNRSADAF